MSACEKCGSDEVSMAYHEPGCGRARCPCASCSYNSHNREHGEHLHYVCCACRYDWIGPVLSVAPPAGQGSGERA